jgi:hypothetical protein
MLISIRDVNNKSGEKFRKLAVKKRVKQAVLFEEMLSTYEKTNHKIQSGTNPLEARIYR